jgi:hypothetical protein
VQDDEGNWFSMRITPYRTLDNRIDGVVLTVVDRNHVEEPNGDRPSGSGADGKRGTATKKKAAPASGKKR